MRIAQVAAALAGGSTIAQRRRRPTYQADLGQLAGMVAERTATPADAFASVWAVTDSTRMTVLLSALEQVGVPYHSRASDPGHGFDCSGFTMYAWSTGRRGLAAPGPARR